MADRAMVVISDAAPNESAVIVGLQIFFFGPNVPGGVDASLGYIHVSYDDFPQDLRGKMTDEVLAQAVQFGYDVVANDILLPKYERGN